MNLTRDIMMKMMNKINWKRVAMAALFIASIIIYMMLVIIYSDILSDIHRDAMRVERKAEIFQYRGVIK